MYIPKHFQNIDLPSIEAFIRQHGFALLITSAGGAPVVSHIPIELDTNKDDKKILRGHLARGNPQWKSFGEQQALAVFQGPHAYISASWYNHVNVPTWNYMAVHVYGKISIVDGHQLYDSLKTLVNKYEATMEHPVTVEGMHTYVEQQMKGIVGFEIAIDKIEGKWKLSQNREEEDYKNVIAELEKLQEENARQVAEEMKKLKNI